MRYFLLAALSILLYSCSSSENDDNIPTPPSNSFDRAAMLTHWANDIIIPGYAHLEQNNNLLKDKIESFTTNPNNSTLNEARTAFQDAYIAWQKVAFFEVGPAANENLRLYFNIYPTDANGIENLKTQNDYQFHLTSNSSKQGYPAIDYLLNGLGTDDAQIINKYTNDVQADQYKRYLKAVANRLKEKTTAVHSAWDSYKTTFIANDGSSANSSVDLIANDYLLFYEKFYRNGKIRIPVGYKTGNIHPEKVEAYYSPALSLVLFKTATTALKDFYHGKNFNTNTKSAGFDSYLKALKRADIATDIDANFTKIEQTANDLNGNLSDIISSDREAILNLNDRIQENVNPLKVEMFQVMNISVAYFDGDGD